MRKKLLIYTMIMKKGGTEQVIANLSNYFIKNYDITLVTNIKSDSEYELDSNIKYINIDSVDKSNENVLKKVFTKLSYRRSRKLKKIIEKEKPDLAIAFLPEPTIRLLSLKKYFPNIKMLFSIRNHPEKEFNFPFLKLIRNYYYKKADSIIIQDESYRKYLSKKVNDKVTVIPNFLSLDFISNRKERIKEKIVVTVSRLEKQKNLGLLIDTFSMLDKRFNDYKLWICGEGKEKKKLAKRIKKLKLENRIILKGRVKSIPDVIEKASLFVLPSNYEGMPNSLLEAMALSLPVISTNSTEVINSIIDNNINGIIVEKNNKRMLKEKIEYILSNPSISKKIGREASKVKNKYDRDKIIKMWFGVFEK